MLILLATVRRAALVVAPWLFVLATLSVVHAQEPDVQAAAAAFQEGQRAQLRGDFAVAADLFELADRSAPDPAALRSAIRNHRAAGQSARAATLAAEAEHRYPEDAETSALAREVIAELSPTLGRLTVRCAMFCALTLDGRAVGEHVAEWHELYAAPGMHVLIATWEGRLHQEVRVALDAGATTALDLTLPVEQEERSPPRLSLSDRVTPPLQSTSRGVHPALFGSLAGAAAVLLAITIGSGIDTLAAAGAYRVDPTRARYDDGVGRELRTNVLTAATAALAVAAFVTAFFTDWHEIGLGPDETVSLRPSAYASSDGAGLTLEGWY